MLHLFSGIGGGALGFQQAEEEWKGIKGDFVTLGGIDNDPEACADFEALTGAKAHCMDLFSEADYKAFHGQEPPEDWQEVVPGDLLKATGGIYPDVIFTSPPCKSFSGLLPAKSANSPKYQSLNNLTIRGIFLSLEAFKCDLPGLILLENVPRITSRGAKELKVIKGMLQSYGYHVSDGYHDCGEIGGLGQTRRRYLLIARQPDKVPAFVYQPRTQKLKSIGEVIGRLPMPDDSAGGPMHRLPRLKWKTWVRLALIPAGGDWRDLQNMDIDSYRLKHIPRTCAFGVQTWDKPGMTVTGHARVGGSTSVAVADVRMKTSKNSHRMMYRVCNMAEPAPTVTGSHGPNSGALVIADPRPKWRNGWKLTGAVGRVTKWDSATDCVLGHSGAKGNGAANVADTRLPKDTATLDPPPVIISLDGTWHRPLTTYELAMLQGFPAHMPNGKPLELTGKSQAKWRERIGNAVPPPAAKAVAETMLRALLPSSEGLWDLGDTPIWVERRHAGKLSKQLLFSLTKKDFEVQTFRSGGKGGQHQNSTDSGVRIFHRESGAVGECRNHRSQHQNRKQAFIRLTENETFKRWLRVKIAVASGRLANLDRQWEEWTKEENFKVEYGPFKDD